MLSLPDAPHGGTFVCLRFPVRRNSYRILHVFPFVKRFLNFFKNFFVFVFVPCPAPAAAVPLFWKKHGRISQRRMLFYHPVFTFASVFSAFSVFSALFLTHTNIWYFPFLLLQAFCTSCSWPFAVPGSQIIPRGLRIVSGQDKMHQGIFQYVQIAEALHQTQHQTQHRIRKTDDRQPGNQVN